VAASVGLLRSFRQEPLKHSKSEALTTGLKSYSIEPVNDAHVLQELAAYAEKHHSTGPKDLSQNIDKYLWDE
jgi:hypothetical protein